MALEVTKKYAKYTIGYGLIFNHPNRLSTIRMEGNTTLDIDGRVSEPGLSTTRTVTEIDYSLLPPWTRIIRQNSPLLTTQTGFDDSEFGLFHSPINPWRCSMVYGDVPAAVTIGTETFYQYSRAVDTDPWTEDSATPSDVTGDWIPILTGGGNPVSGGKEADNEANSIEIELAGVPYFASTPIFRLPWENPWAEESVLLSDAFDAFIAAGGADYSGTCTATVYFVP